ncbi:MAG: hypothetical protein R2734_13670 [Nocardioides sp.]
MATRGHVVEAAEVVRPRRRPRRGVENGTRGRCTLRVTAVPSAVTLHAAGRWEEEAPCSRSTASAAPGAGGDADPPSVPCWPPTGATRLRWCWLPAPAGTGTWRLVALAGYAEQAVHESRATSAPRRLRRHRGAPGRPLVSPCSGGRFRLSPALGTGATAAVRQSAAERAAWAREAERLHEDGRHVLADTVRGGVVMGPEAGAGGPASTRSGCAGDGPPAGPSQAGELVAAWRAAEDASCVPHVGPGVVRGRLRAAVLRATGDGTAARAGRPRSSGRRGPRRPAAA